MAWKTLVAYLLYAMFLVIAEATDPVPKVGEQTDRKARAWHHSLPGPQMLLQQHQQNLPAPVSTSQPGESSLQQTPNHHQPNDPNNINRNFEDQDKPAIPAASEQDFLSRHFGYMNVHRFDPNFPYFERHAYPGFPTPQLPQHGPRFGPGYRKDKYGHGYGYSCKQGDDCDEVRAANQLAAAQPPPHMQHPHHHNHAQAFGSNYPELPPFPSLPSFSSMPSFPSYGSQFGQPPARFNDPQAPPMPSMYPNRFYHGRYLHDEENNGNKEASKGVPQNPPQDSQKTIDDVNF